eukprot:103045-Rhodomonas_salina.3
MLHARGQRAPSLVHASSLRSSFAERTMGHDLMGEEQRKRKDWTSSEEEHCEEEALFLCPLVLAPAPSSCPASNGSSRRIKGGTIQEEASTSAAT